MKIGILECGSNRPEWAQYGRFADWFPPLLSQAGLDFETQAWNVSEGEFPSGPELCDAWLLTGSPASAVDDAPWQLALSEFLRPVIGQTPVIGICYGHQHLHRMLGGTVEECPDWGVGVQHYALKDAPDWLEDQADAAGFDLVALHHDQVTRPAPDTRVFAGSAFCPYGVTQIGPCTLTFQPHPEMDPAFAAEVYDFERHRIGESETDAALRTLDHPRDTSRAARWIMGFLAHQLEDRT
ncbi:type 1 glutamine amidotransferase [Phaeobacter sp. HF9A]|uniref:glutamine amidotransferase-related protein n=1 Tax=Phaeobacter sp. HF9A TaxID=2721561 RepID=UPI00142FE8D1|nr:type 1 glutamine amidotransferase [Phaeobacter sp. HF9A]NIZ12109.1 type 1 glutamine amidotransferase [Phaeobacter sp. HF9A]